MTTLIGPPAIPTSSSAAVGTIVVQTAQAAFTQTAALIPPSPTPTLTPRPTKTPTDIPSPTPTFRFFLATPSRTPAVPTAGPGGPASTDLACKLTGQTPADDSTVSKGGSFNASWTVENTGAGTWDSNSVDFIYLNGSKLAGVKAADLPKSVAAGESVTLKLTMAAPSASGTYKTVWTLRQGKTEFCHLSLSIVVP